MSKITSIVENMKYIHYQHDKALKVKHVFSFEDGSKVMLYRKPSAVEVVQPYLVDESSIVRILDADLDKLHEMMANNHRDKVRFRDSLYEKYGISKATHRINVMDGIIEEIKNG